MDHNDFDTVSWRNDTESEVSGPAHMHTDTEDAEPSTHDVNGKRRMSSASEEPSAHAHEDMADLTGLDGVLECTVDSPLKENDGTKDAFISYLVTTHVGLLTF